MMFGLLKKKPKPKPQRNVARQTLTVHIDNDDTFTVDVKGVDTRVIGGDGFMVYEVDFISAERKLRINLKKLLRRLVTAGAGTEAVHYPPHRIKKITMGPVTIEQEKFK